MDHPLFMRSILVCSHFLIAIVQSNLLQENAANIYANLGNFLTGRAESSSTAENDMVNLEETAKYVLFSSRYLRWTAVAKGRAHFTSTEKISLQVIVPVHFNFVPSFFQARSGWRHERVEGS